MPVIKTSKELVDFFRIGAVSLYNIICEFGCLYSRPLLACFIWRPSISSICSNHIKSFLLLLLLQVHPPFGIKPMVLVFKNLFLGILLNADAMVKDSRKTTKLPFSINSRMNIWQSYLKKVTSYWHYISKTSSLSKTLFFRPSYHDMNSLLSHIPTSSSP